MNKLADVPRERLEAAFADADDAKAVKRLVVALAYTDGVGVDTIAHRYGIPQSTVYYWLDRFEKQSIEDALHDEQRPGRPSKLTATQRTEVDDWLTASPRAFGYDADEWTAERLRDLIDETFDVRYSSAHVHRQFLK